MALTPPGRRVWAGEGLGWTLVLLILLAVGGANADRLRDPEPIEARQVILKHRPVAEVVASLTEVLSPAGQVEVRVGENALLIRDRAENVERVAALIARLDRPRKRYRVRASVVRAGGGEDLMVSGGRLPEELLSSLRRHLRFETYRLEASGVAEAEADAGVDLAIGSRYRTSFTLRSTEAEDRVRLEGFRLFRSAKSDGPLVHTHVNLHLAKPMILGLARNVRSRQALMVVLVCEELGTGEAIP